MINMIATYTTFSFLTTTIISIYAYLKIQLFASMGSLYLKPCSVAISMRYIDSKRSNTLALYGFLVAIC